jgi:5-hydroxyisourate hydrolase
VTGLSTHVLDAALGRPASGVPITLRNAAGAVAGIGSTDHDGRVPDLSRGQVETATYQLVFDTAVYFAASGQPGFYPEVVITFSVTDPKQHHHVPLLLSPFAYSTYRGS